MKWISVDNELPEFNSNNDHTGYVLMTNGHEVWTGQFYKYDYMNHWEIHTNPCDDRDSTGWPTYWMAIPKLPA